MWTVSVQSPTCQLQSGGDCVCGDPNVHSYCGTSSCPPEDRLVGNPIDYCRTLRTIRQFVPLPLHPDEWELLLDSDDYWGNLLGSVFLEREYDGDNRALIAVNSTVADSHCM